MTHHRLTPDERREALEHRGRELELELEHVRVRTRELKALLEINRDELETIPVLEPAAVRRHILPPAAL